MYEPRSNYEFNYVFQQLKEYYFFSFFARLLDFREKEKSTSSESKNMIKKDGKLCAHILAITALVVGLGYWRLRKDKENSTIKEHE